MDRTYVYEVHDTPFGTYTMKFIEKCESNHILNERIMQNMKDLSKSADLPRYNLLQSETEDGNKFYQLVTDEEGERDERIQIYHREEEMKPLLPVEEKVLIEMIEKSDPVLSGQISYDFGKSRGRFNYNGTEIVIEFMGYTWGLYWEDRNSYSIGILRELIMEQDPDFLKDKDMNWIFKSVEGNIKECVVYFSAK